MDQVMLIYNEVIGWFLSLNLAEKMGVLSFALIVLNIFARLVMFLINLFPKKTAPVISFKIEDVHHEMFKKKGFVTFDLYVRNNGTVPIDLLRVGFVLSDGVEMGIYQQAHEIKLPDNSHLLPGHEAFYNDCDLYYALNENGVNYKKITGLFADIQNSPRIYETVDVHPILNDHAIRGVLTDRKGLNGF